MLLKAFHFLPTQWLKTQPLFHILNLNKLNHQQNIMTQSLPSRSNQDEFSKSNAARQSAGTVVHDKNGNGKVAAQWQNTFYWKTRQECGEYFKIWSLFQIMFKITSWLCNMLKRNSKLETDYFFTGYNVSNFQRI